MANYYKQDGNYKHTDMADYSTQAVFQRYNFRANVDVDITKNFYVKVDLGARITDRNAPGTTASRVVSIANTQPPHLPITLQDNGNAANETYALNNPKGMLYGDQAYPETLCGTALGGQLAFIGIGTRHDFFFQLFIERQIRRCFFYCFFHLVLYFSSELNISTGSDICYSIRKMR